MTKTYYFAYGSNMSVKRMLARVPSAVVIGTATLHGYRLAFHKDSFDGSAKCDIITSNGAADCVHGVLYAINVSDLKSLDLAEGAGYAYDRRTIDLDSNSGRVAAECYFARGTMPGLTPYGWYLEHILVGARQAQLPVDYIARIAAIDFTDDPDVGRHTRELSLYEIVGSCDVDCRSDRYNVLPFT